MLRDITIGQYYPSDSILHQLDPRVKLMGTLVYVLSLFFFRGVSGFLAVTLGLAVLIRLSGVPVGYMVKGLKAIAVILILTGMFNLLLTPGEPLISFGGVGGLWLMEDMLIRSNSPWKKLNGFFGRWMGAMRI